MPIPKPHKGERKRAFIQRCMGDDVMVKEYPRSDQRRAVCEGAWDEKHALIINYLRTRGWSACQISAYLKDLEGE